MSGQSCYVLLDWSVIH